MSRKTEDVNWRDRKAGETKKEEARKSDEKKEESNRESPLKSEAKSRRNKEEHDRSQVGLKEGDPTRQQPERRMQERRGTQLNMGGGISANQRAFDDELKTDSNKSYEI